MRILITASLRDLRFARACIASVRKWYPDAEICILPGAELPLAFIREVAKYWNIALYQIESGHYGWGFAKLEPLFKTPGETFLILDADTVMTGPVLTALESRLAASDSPDFIVDEEDQPEVEMRRLYYEWDASDVNAKIRRPAFVFNSGQWLGRSGVVKREDFSEWIEWTFPRRLKMPDVFKNGDQGVLNFVFNQKVMTSGLRVGREPLMRWPGHGMDGFDVEAVRAGTAPARVVHWAGIKRLRFSSMPGADLLDYFEESYYERIPGGSFLRRWRATFGVGKEIFERCKTRVRLFWAMKVMVRLRSK